MSITIKDLGYYYESAKINDTWGELNVNGGGIILSLDFKKAYLTKPFLSTKDSVKGDGYILKFNPNHIVQSQDSILIFKEKVDLKKY